MGRLDRALKRRRCRYVVDTLSIGKDRVPIPPNSKVENVSKQASLEHGEFRLLEFPTTPRWGLTFFVRLVEECQRFLSAGNRPLSPRLDR
jgi:hypothetical protein